MEMEKVFVVFEVIAYEGEYIRGIYLSREEAVVREKFLNKDVDGSDYEYIEVRELEVGVDMDVI
jgi:hypothetical protein